jgi:hypothetical protein
VTLCFFARRQDQFTAKVRTTEIPGNIRIATRGNLNETDGKLLLDIPSPLMMQEL